MNRIYSTLALASALLALAACNDSDVLSMNKIKKADIISIRYNQLK